MRSAAARLRGCAATARVYTLAMRRLVPGLLAVAALVTTGAAQAPQYSGELIFPQESWHNHSSSIVELPNGDLLVCWFHGSGERTADDVVIRGARWSRTARTWSAPFLMADTPGFPETNPVLFLDNRQRLFFLWPLIVAHRWETALMKYRISTDYQQSAGPPQWGFQDNIVLVPRNIEAKAKALAATVPPGNVQMTEVVARLVERAGDEYFSRMGWFTRTHPLQLPSGRILVPMYSDGFSFGIMGISDDGGLTWTGSEPVVGGGGVQPSVVRKNDGTLVAYLRDNGPAPKRALMSVSKDDGVSWTIAQDSELLNPGTSIEVVRLSNGHWIAVYNDLERDRHSLVAAISQDEGTTWPFRRHLDGSRAQAPPNQYHYPSVIQARDGAIHVTYSYFTPAGKSIKHVRFDEAWVRAGDR
jgi:predicted neuraminidase